jgi:RNA recognition motif-containing protein
VIDESIVNSLFSNRIKESRVNIYVGNLSRDVSETGLREAFQAFGEVTSCNIIKDKFTDESRGFGFVEMPNKEEADKAIAGLSRVLPRLR